MEYEALPSPVELDLLAERLGLAVSFERRIWGGQSATTDILIGDRGQRVVLRRHGRWSVGFDDGIAAREEAVLRVVRGAGVPAPRVLWSGQLGAATAIATEFVHGVAIIDPADPMRWASQLATTLAKIHSVAISPSLASILRSAPPSPVDLEPPARFFDHPQGRDLLSRRSALAASVRSGTCLVHGDYWPGNLLWREDHVAAVLDWEAAVLGDPVSDVAYCFAEMRYFGLDEAADHFVATYRDITQSALESLPYWTVTALCRALPELDSYLDGWSGLGFEPDPVRVRHRLSRLIAEMLSD